MVGIQKQGCTNNTTISCVNAAGSSGTIVSSSACNLALTAGDLSRRAVANESRVAVVSNLQYINNANNQRVHRIPSAERPRILITT